VLPLPSALKNKNSAYRVKIKSINDGGFIEDSVELGSDNCLRAATSNGFAKHTLAVPGAIQIGSVKEVHPQIKSGMDGFMIDWVWNPSDQVRKGRIGFGFDGMYSRLTKDGAKGFYAVHKGKPFFESLTDFMSSGEIIVMVLERENAIARWKKATAT
jgi:hypothetical protein